MVFDYNVKLIEITYTIFLKKLIFSNSKICISLYSSVHTLRVLHRIFWLSGITLFHELDILLQLNLYTMVCIILFRAYEKTIGLTIILKKINYTINYSYMS